MWIKKYLSFKESLVINTKLVTKISESLSIWINNLLDAIGAKPVDIYSVLPLSNKDNIDLEFLENNSNFIKELSNAGLKKTNLENTSDYETFLDIPCRFIFILNKKAGPLDNPYYILLQSFNLTLDKWENTVCYKLTENIKNFYDKLSSKVIEIQDGDKKFIYETSDKNTWILKSVEETEIYKRNFSKEELEKLIQNRKAKVNVI